MPSPYPICIVCLPSVGRISAVNSLPHVRLRLPTPSETVSGSVRVCQPLDYLCKFFSHFSIFCAICSTPKDYYTYTLLVIVLQIHDSDMITGHPLEKIINGPAHHTLHHLYFTVNYGQVRVCPFILMTWPLTNHTFCHYSTSRLQIVGVARTDSQYLNLIRCSKSRCRRQSSGRRPSAKPHRSALSLFVSSRSDTKMNDNNVISCHPAFDM